MAKQISGSWIAVVTIVWMAAASAAELAGLPVRGSAEQPSLLLELGGESPSVAAKDATTRVFTGEIAANQGDTSIRTDKDEVTSLHPGFGAWNVAFRFRVKPGLAAIPYTFWARWRQGGEPDVCVQTFEIWAGPDISRLEQRAAFQLKPKGWEYAWIAAEPPVTLKADDAVIEVRNSGAGHDAKIFDAFLLGPPPPPPALPAAGTTDRPLVLLDLGKTPVRASSEKNTAVQVRLGTPTAQQGADSLLTEKDEVQVFHKGFGAWGATFQFDLKPAIPPGLYSFFARYKSGGEVSQVAQTFTIKAGADPKNLATRGTFVFTNTSPWEY